MDTHALGSSRIRCLACATEQEACTNGGPWECLVCGAPLGTTPAAVPARAVAPCEEPEPKAAPSAGAKDRLDQLLSDIPRNEAPLVEPLRERHWGFLAAIVGTPLVLLSIFLALSPTVEDVFDFRTRVEHDARQLADLVERYRIDTGGYPDAEVWKLSVQQNDRRFFDPWGRPYLYQVGATTFTISSYGADGQAGGEAGAADASLAFPGGDGGVSPPPASKGNR